MEEVSPERHGCPARSRTAPAALVAAAVAALTAAAAFDRDARAARYWDTNAGSAGGSNQATATGGWGTQNFWSTSAAGTASTGPWVAHETAVFAAGADVTGSYTVTVAGSQSAGGLTFEEGTVMLNGGAISLTGAAPAITVGALDAPRTAQIGAALTGPADAPVHLLRGTSAAATLSLTGSNTFAGGLSIGGGLRVNVNHPAALGVDAGAAVAVTGGGALLSRTGVGSATVNKPIVINPQAAAGGFALALGAAGGIFGDTRLEFAGGISGAGDVHVCAAPSPGGAGDASALPASGNGLTAFAAANTYTGATVVNTTGALQLRAAGALPPHTALVFGRGQASGPDIGLVDLRGRDVTLASLATHTAGAVAAQGITNTDPAAGGAITVTGAAHTVFAAGIGALNNAALLTHGFSGTDNLALTLSAAHAGRLTLAGPLGYRGPTTVAGGTLTLKTSLAASASVSILNGAKIELAPREPAGGEPRVIRTGALSLAAGARLDLGDGLLVTTSPAGHASGDAGDVRTYDGIQGLVQAARNDGEWDLPGIGTSVPAARPQHGGLTTIGVARAEEVVGLAPDETGLWHGQTVTGASTLAMYTYAGDGNLDGFVDGGDYAYIDVYVGSSGADVSYGHGDYNYDGYIDGGDYAYIDVTVGSSGPPFPTGIAGAGVTVPEPSALTLLFITLPCIARRRRRRR